MVIVTGGARGIGAVISRLFHASGDFVLVASRTESALTTELGQRARFIPCDVRRASDLRAVVEAATDWRGAVDVFVNNAGWSEWRPIAQVDEAFWNTMIDINLKGVLFGCQAAATCLESGGCIVNISSLAGKRGSANNAVYCAAKFGVNGITQALAKELGPRGIRVNAVCPVYVETDRIRSALSGADSPAQGQGVDAYLAAFAATQTALGRLPLAEEVAQVVYFLASPAASAITGQCINVDCGTLPQ